MARQILREHPSADHLSCIDMSGNLNLDNVAEGVKSWLSLPNNTRWLLICDNYDNPKVPGSKGPVVDIRRHLPDSYQGAVIITTRSSEVKIGRTMRIQKLENLRDSLEILSKTSGREELVNDPEAEMLAKELDGLPLALATAGAYLDQTTMTFRNYLRLYKASWTKLQKSSPEIDSYEDRTLYSTWQLSFENVERQNKVSAKLLCFWAYIDNQDIWFELLHRKELLHHKIPDDYLWIRELTEDELSFNAAVRVLSNHGLIEADMSLQERTESSGYSIHGCVHSWTIHVLNQQWNSDLAKLAIKLVALHIPLRGSAKWWLTQRRLLQHASRCSFLTMNGLVADSGLELALQKLGNLFSAQGKLDDAEKMYQRALQGYEKAGADRVPTQQVLVTVNNLGNLYKDQARFDAAEKMYQRALQGHEELSGADHTLTLSTANNLGLLYAEWHKLDMAEAMYQRALQGYEKTCGLQHPDTLNTVNNLGILYATQGKVLEADRMYQWALREREKLLGPDHTLTLSTVHNLGFLYATQNKFRQAEEMYERALKGKEKALGTHHAFTLDTVNALGALYLDQGKLEEAERMFQRALQGREKVLGPDHASTLGTVMNMGILYADQGRRDEAEKLYKRALQGQEKALGAEHESTLKTLVSLGVLYKSWGKLDEAEKKYLRVLQARERALGPDHKLTLSTVDHLGAVYAEQHRFEEAEKMYRRAMQGYEKIEDEIEMLGPIHNLGALFADQSKLDEAEKMYDLALQGKEKALDMDHISTLATVRCIGLLHRAQGKPEEAKEMLERALRGYQKAVGASTMERYAPALTTMFNMGEVLEDQGKLDQAKDFYLRARSGALALVGPSSEEYEKVDRAIRSMESRKTF